MGKKGGKKMNTPAKIIPFTYQTKKQIGRTLRSGVRKAIPFSKMSEQDQKESMEALKDE